MLRYLGILFLSLNFSNLNAGIVLPLSSQNEPYASLVGRFEASLSKPRNFLAVRSIQAPATPDQSNTQKPANEGTSKQPAPKPEKRQAQKDKEPKEIIVNSAKKGLLTGLIIGAAVGIPAGIAVSRTAAGVLGGIAVAAGSILLFASLGVIVGLLIGIGQVVERAWRDP